VEQVQLTLIGKPDCHLCDDARAVIAGVLAEIATDPDAPKIAVTELSILDEPRLHQKYVEEIPVVLIDGRMHTYWRVDRARLTKALLEKK
jgi:hypothetical protein